MKFRKVIFQAVHPEDNSTPDKWCNSSIKTMILDSAKRISSVIGVPIAEIYQELRIKENIQVDITNW